MGCSRICCLFLCILSSCCLFLPSATCPTSCSTCVCFPSSTHFLTLPNNIPAGSTIATPPALSPSALPLTYTLSGSADFTLSSNGDGLVTATALDYSAVSEYQLEIQATDGNSTALLNVNITLIDTTSIGNILICTAETIQFEVMESVSNVSIPLPMCFNGNGAIALVTELSYTISSGNPNALFEISSTGVLSSHSPLDYETETDHTLVVGVANSELPPRTTTLVVTVTVLPVNEYPPAFNPDPIQVAISEAISVGATLGSVLATDQDTGDDGIVMYSLTPSDGPIFVHPDSGAIILTRSLDHEMTQVHNFTITASDNSHTSRMSTTTLLSIIVQDANDNSPSFSRPFYSSEVQEDSNPGHTVTTLACSDADTGANGQVTYSISDGNQEAKFAVNTMTGSITLADTVDYDDPSATRTYTLTVRCREVRSPYATSETLLLIRITSSNDFYPDPGNVYVVNIREDTQPGTELLQVMGRDRDYGPAGTLRYFLDLNDVPTCPDNLFMDVGSGRMYLMSTFDYEMGGVSFHCILSVWDSEQPIHISEQDIFISIVNVNDARPVCDPSVYSTEIAEDVRVGGVVLTLACTDPDSPNLQYFFTDGSIEVFSMSQSGELSLRQNLDFETRSRYLLNVQVSDGEYTTNTSVYVTVTSINEHAPTFTNTPNCTVPENSIQGTPVCILEATDADLGEDGDISFEIVTSNSAFQIDSDSGLMYVVGDIDRENASEYTLTVRAVDKGLPPLSSEVIVVVSIADVNDNAPQVAAHIFANISEDSLSGSLVTEVTCSDADGVNSPNSNTQLQIESVSEESTNGMISLVVTPLFAINTTTGELRTVGQLDFETVSLYHISLTCRDQGSPSLTTPTTVHVRVTPVNEFPPTFPQATYEFTIPENTSLGATVGNVTATDGDSGTQGDITYSIHAPIGGPFWIDPQTGALHVVGRLQCHMETRHVVGMRARDGGDPARERSVNVTVNVDRCHLGELVPSSGMYVGSVLENALTGTFVLEVSCTSTRSLTIAHPVYMLTQTSAMFQVDGSSGNVTVQSPPDYELSTSHLLHVRCSDPTHSEIYADMLAYVSVVPVNEHPPAFEEQSYTFSISESAVPGTSLGVVRAVDMDGGTDGEVAYSVRDTSEVLIDQNTGALYLARYLDREDMDTLTMTVTAFDSPSDPSLTRTSTVEVTLSVLDSNDNWPICDRTVYHVYASPQTTPPFVLLANPNCTDADIGSNAHLMYSLGNASDIFTINPSTGELSLIGTFDPEDGPTYRVPLLVRDSGTTPLSVTLLVIVDLQAPPLELPSGSNNQDYLSLVDAEGRKNSVNITLEDLSIPIWEESMVAMEKFHSAVARSVTSHCAIFPEACSLIAGCAQFFGSITFDPTRRKRNTHSVDETNNYANFNQPHVVILPNHTTELQDIATGQGNTISLKIEFYVKLPEPVNRSPNRATNYVVPKATLKHIVSQDREVIGAVVRNSVSPSLTEGLVDGWRVAASVFVVVISVAVFAAIVVAVVFTGYKYKQISMNRVIPLKSPKAKKPSPKPHTNKIIQSLPPQTQQTSSTNKKRPSVAHIFTVGGAPPPGGTQCISTEQGSSATNRHSRSKMCALVDSDQTANMHTCSRHLSHSSFKSHQSMDTSAQHHRGRSVTGQNANGFIIVGGHSQSRKPNSINLGRKVNSNSKPNGTHNRALMDSNQRVVNGPSQAKNRVSIGSNQSSLSTDSDLSGITNISMENQVSRGGSDSPRRISSEDLDQSQSSGDGLKLENCDEMEEEDLLGPFPFTRPTNPVRTNGLSLWRVWR